ncbi:MAG: LysR family transcriptional regulator [Alphaproteobacteria bacterium]|nr:LysR family transcriptional regulator [Alphaproteobacteria bacterium]
MPTIKTKITFLRELLALKEVIDLGQIQAAADRNEIKHSNMSKIISDLEARFKTRLLIRSSAGSVPTNTTRQLYADIENISNALDNIFHNITGPDELTGHISIWTEEGFAGSRLFTELYKLYAKHPKIRLDILTNRHMNMSNPDISILDIRSLQKIPGNKPLFKFKTKTKFYTTPEYLNKHGVPKDMDDMLENFELCVRQKFLQLPECNFILKRAKKLNLTTDSASIAYQLVCDGAGISLMPEWCTMRNERLVEVPNIDFDYEYILTGIGNPLTIKSPKVQAFLEFFYDFCNEYDIPLEMFE